MLTIFQRHRARILSVLAALSLVVFLLQVYASFTPPRAGGSRGPGLEFAHPSGPSSTPSTADGRPPGDDDDDDVKNSDSNSNKHGHNEDDADHGTTPAPSLPAEYLTGPPEPDFCRDRYGLRYLENVRDSATSHCAPGSTSSLTCFWSSTAQGEERVDAMCVGTDAVLSLSSSSSSSSSSSLSSRFQLDCALQNPERGAHAVPGALTKYWYGTGPGNVVKEAVDFVDGRDSSPAETAAAGRRTTVLVHREGSHNLWHSLMEIMSTSWTLDVLRMTTPPSPSSSSSGAFLADADADSTQIVLLDDHDDGPYIDLWRLFARLPSRRLADLPRSEPPSSTIVLPLAGGSNPLWQGDWTDLACHDTPLVKTFVARALAHLAIDAPPPPVAGANVSVTFITRTNTRKLLREDAHVAALRAAIPHMTLDVVDFAAVPFREQLAIVRRTDLLVGVHGAGLTHLIFLQPGSAVVEILPEGFAHKGFRNLAQMLGHGYFRTHAHKAQGAHRRDTGFERVDSKEEEAVDRRETGGQQEEESKEGNEKQRRAPRLRARDWQNDDVDIGEDALLDIVGAAVKSLYSKSLRSFDVS